LMIVYFAIDFQKKFETSSAFIGLQKWYVILDGKFERGKTRFLTLMSRDAREKNMFVLCNFYNKYEDIRWSSIPDLINLLSDLWLLGECQNHTEDDIKLMYAKEWKARVKEKLDQIRKIKRRYKSIPYNGFFSRFFIAGDEMQNIFYNRESMTNFTGDKKPLLKLLHQIRHYNGLAAFALTDVSEIDIKFRKIASFYISFTEFMSDLFIKYIVYRFDVDKENNFDMEKATKVTRVPVVKFNGYQANKIINKIEQFIKKRIKFRFQELGFFSKFNADPDHSCYTPWYLFEYLNTYYKTNKKMGTENSN
jgi:hypothetical protein